MDSSSLLDLSFLEISGTSIESSVNESSFLCEPPSPSVPLTITVCVILTNAVGVTLTNAVTVVSANCPLVSFNEFCSEIAFVGRNGAARRGAIKAPMAKLK